MHVKYHDGACQRNHWSNHKKECKTLRAGAELRDEASGHEEGQIQPWLYGCFVENFDAVEMRAMKHFKIAACAGL